MVQRIPLTRGQTAIIDDADFAYVSSKRWVARPRDASTGGFYAYRSCRGKTIYLHRELLCATRGQVVDHINGDGLDNRRENLRITDLSGNGANRPSLGGKTGYRGVERSPRAAGQFVFRATVGRRENIWRGPWRTTAAEAARDYDRVALGRFGECARLNFPNGGDE